MINIFNKQIFIYKNSWVWHVFWFLIILFQQLLVFQRFFSIFQKNL